MRLKGRELKVGARKKDVLQLFFIRFKRHGTTLLCPLQHMLMQKIPRSHVLLVLLDVGLTAPQNQASAYTASKKTFHVYMSGSVLVFQFGDPATTNIHSSTAALSVLACELSCVEDHGFWVP